MKENFCRFWRNAAAPVTVITSSISSTLAGMTISSLTSLSVGPPKLMVSFNCQSPSRTASVLLQRKKLMVNMLSTRPDNVLLAKAFAGRTADGHKLNPFEKYPLLFTDKNEAKIPMITDCVGNLLCTVENSMSVQDHDIIVASVDRVWVNDKLSPLVYRRHQFLGLTPYCVA